MLQWWRKLDRSGKDMALSSPLNDFTCRSYFFFFAVMQYGHFPMHGG
jgi:hypothetical protein